MTRIWQANAPTLASILAATTPSARAQKPAYKVLYNFAGPPADWSLTRKATSMAPPSLAAYLARE